ncbi:hypothetical protein Tco_0714440 [Tanacetum coccineum]
MVASSGWPFVFAVPGQMTHLVASLTTDNKLEHASISPDGFLPSILLLLVIIVAVAIVVMVILVVVVVGEGVLLGPGDVLHVIISIFHGSSGTGSLSSGRGMIHNEFSNSAKIGHYQGIVPGGVT